jgi:hypothetical protein
MAGLRRDAWRQLVVRPAGKIDLVVGHAAGR